MPSTGLRFTYVGMETPLIDPFARPISYLRVSVTDRCDFRCLYCMSENMTFLPKKDLLTLEELPGHVVRRLELHTPVRIARVEVWDEEAEDLVERSIETTIGRLVFNQILPPRLRYTEKTNRSMARAQLREVVADCYRLLGRNETAHLVDGIKSVGFRYATQGGMTIAVDDIRVPESKKGLLEAADKKVADIDAQYQRGLITDDERYARVVDVRSRAEVRQFLAADGNAADGFSAEVSTAAFPPGPQSYFAVPRGAPGTGTGATPEEMLAAADTLEQASQTQRGIAQACETGQQQGLAGGVVDQRRLDRGHQADGDEPVHPPTRKSCGRILLPESFVEPNQCREEEPGDEHEEEEPEFAGNIDDEPARDYDVIGFDFAWHLKNFTLRGEYVKTKLGADYVGITASPGATWKTWYTQASYQFPQTKWEPVLRYADFDSPHSSQDQKQWAVGLNYLFTGSFIGKLTYEFNDGLSGSQADTNRWMLQLAYGF